MSKFVSFLLTFIVFMTTTFNIGTCTNVNSTTTEVITTTTTTVDKCADDQNIYIIGGRGGLQQMAFYRMLGCDYEKYILYSSLIGVGCILFVAILAVICFCWMKNKSKRAFARFDRSHDQGFPSMNI